ncbi:MAG: hypothetical protein MUE69_29290 [Myxococcota bacterium]|nr:hypothetical protein [Myxococcota bacterium]
MSDAHESSEPPRKPARGGREVTSLTRAAAHDVRGRSNTLTLVVALLEEHADPLVQKAVAKVRRASAELVELAAALEATGELHRDVEAPRVRVSALVELFASRANVTVTSSVAASSTVATDSVALVDAVRAVLAEPRELRLDAEGTYATLKLPGARPRLGTSPSLAGLRLELAAQRGGGELEVDVEGATIRLRLVD